MRKLILKNHQCPGDVLAMTAAVESLHLTYPSEYQTDCRTTAWEIWQHNPRVTSICSDDPDATAITMEYPAIHRCNSEPMHMIEAFTEYLGQQIGKPLTTKINRPVVYLSDEERGWVNQVRDTFTGGREIPFWLVNAGSKSDFPAKQWPVEYYQEVVDQTHGLIQWVQVGASEHYHPELRGVMSLVGKTDTRQLIRLAWHASGGIGGITFLMHLMAAHKKPYVCLAGGREPVQWISYPQQHTLHTIGGLSCCQTSACWKSVIVPHENKSVCDKPVFGMTRPVARCLAMIQPREVITTLERICASF